VLSVQKTRTVEVGRIRRGRMNLLRPSPSRSYPQGPRSTAYRVLTDKSDERQ
jgi:hypothetical protein